MSQKKIIFFVFVSLLTFSTSNAAQQKPSLQYAHPSPHRRDLDDDVLLASPQSTQRLQKALDRLRTQTPQGYYFDAAAATRVILGYSDEEFYIDTKN